MSITITIGWWAIPLAITTAALLWAFFWPAQDSGFFGGIARLFMLVPALIVSLLAWAIAGALK